MQLNKRPDCKISMGSGRLVLVTFIGGTDHIKVPFFEYSVNLEEHYCFLGMQGYQQPINIGPPGGLNFALENLLEMYLVIQGAN